MAYTLPDLPYAYDALEPYIDEATMRLHHDKHHAAYLAKFVAAVEGSEFDGVAVEKLLGDLKNLPAAMQGAVRNHGGGFVNHTLFWNVMGPGKGGAPSGALATAINSAFGSLDAFKTEFANAAGTRFGSGWAWLVVKAGGALAVYSTGNQDSPLMDGDTPILGLDVWEHAYYLKYQNRRPDYLAAWWNVIDWDQVNQRLK
jgi:Fe-Mn family superoxide dismutase